MKQTYKPVFKLLGRYMNNDAVSIIEGLKPYFQEYDKPHWEETVKNLQAFLAESYTLNEKEIFIQSYIDLSFDTKRSAPILWLTTVLGAIEYQIMKVNAKEAAIEEFSKKYERLTTFLARFQCHRHFTPEDVLNRYFKETTLEDWDDLAKLIRDFLAEDLSKGKKIAIIERYAEIDFHYRNMPPLLWLKGVASSLDYRINWENL